MNTLKKSIRFWLFVTALTVSCGFYKVTGAVVYVNHSAAGANNGTSWANAFVNLSDALDVASSGDEIWVAGGVYKPGLILDFNGSGGTDLREATFQIPSGVMLYGGFNGTEVSRGERDWEANLTILSGDIDNNDINLDGNFIAEDTDDIVGNNAYHIIFTVNATTSTGVDGFTITAGSASITPPLNPFDPNLDGGAWINLHSIPGSSSPSIINTTFQGNYAKSEGGALFGSPGSPGATMISLIENCKFINNKSDFSGGAIQLGSFSAGNYQPTITNCEFTGNSAWRRGGALYFIGDHAVINNTSFNNNTVTVISPDGSTLPGSGGAVSLVASNAQFTACMFSENSATGNPTGQYEGGGGGAVYISTNTPQTLALGASEPKFINCGFYANTASDNTAAWGGAVVHLNDGGMLRPKYVGCVFTDNQAQNHGGAIANFTRVLDDPGTFTAALEPTLTNCTFTENHAGQSGGAVYHDGYLFDGSEVLTATIQNSILWHNTASTSGPEIFNMGGIVNISYSLIEGSGGSGGGWLVALGTDAGNNIDVSPGFTNSGNPLGPDNIPATADDGLRLGLTSPAIDQGNNAASGLIGITTDYIGNARILGGDVDMGAYERAGVIIPDLDIYWLSEWRDILNPCLSCPWAILLADPVIRNFKWEEPAQLIMYEDHAVVTGSIVNVQNSNIAFEVFLKLSQAYDWDAWRAKRRIYSVSNPLLIKAAYFNHSDWMYFELSDESYLSGKGDVKGTLKLRHWPANFKTGFQLGAAANGWDKDFGLSGSFEYRGTVKIKNKKYSLKGLGSLNVDAEKCLKDCEPLIEKGLTLPLSETLSHKTTNSGPAIYPNPARDFVTISTTQMEGTYLVKLVDDVGHIRQVEELRAVDGQVTLLLKDQQAGIYHIVITSSQGLIENHKIIMK